MTPTPEMKAFLRDLADLMEKHNVKELYVTEDDGGFYPTVEGLEVEIESAWDNEGELTRDYCSVNIGRYIDRGTLKTLAEKE